VCRTSGTGVVVGCVECIGPNVPGGNDQGYNDSACNPNDATKIQECDANNKLVERACAGSKVCQGATPSSCDTCDDGVTGTADVVCTQPNLIAAQKCGGCTIDIDGGNGSQTANLVECTEDAIDSAVISGGSNTCAGQGFGPAVGSWGGVSNCCRDSTEGYSGCIDNTGPQTVDYGFPTNGVPGVPQCCGDFANVGGGGAFAYCVEP
jgi:hypothetical protein